MWVVSFFRKVQGCELPNLKSQMEQRGCPAFRRCGLPSCVSNVWFQKLFLNDPKKSQSDSNFLKKRHFSRRRFSSLAYMSEESLSKPYRCWCSLGLFEYHPRESQKYVTEMVTLWIQEKVYASGNIECDSSHDQKRNLKICSKI